MVIRFFLAGRAYLLEKRSVDRESDWGAPKVRGLACSTLSHVMLPAPKSQPACRFCNQNPDLKSSGCLASVHSGPQSLVPSGITRGLPLTWGGMSFGRTCVTDSWNPFQQPLVRISPVSWGVWSTAGSPVASAPRLIGSAGQRAGAIGDELAEVRNGGR